MKAAVYEKHGTPDILALREVEKPVPDEHEVLVKICAASVNALDYRTMQMGLGIPKKKIFGAAIAGRVEAVGKGVRSFHAGDAVLGDLSECGCGGFAEYVAAREDALAHKPDGVSFEQAAALPVAAVTALQALRDKGDIHEGQKVLISGAGGGVGPFAVQLAKYYGATVTAVCGAKNLEMVRSLGADHVMDYLREDFTKGAVRYDLIIAVNGGHPLSSYKHTLAPGGICVVVGGPLSQIFKSIFFGPFISMGGKRLLVLAATPSREDLAFVVNLMAAGKVKAIIDRRYPLSKAAEALRYLGEGHSQGKVIVRVSQDED